MQKVINILAVVSFIGVTDIIVGGVGIPTRKMQSVNDVKGKDD